MRLRTYYSYRDNIRNDYFDWIHIYAGKPVPPIHDGSYNHLIWELVQQKASSQLLIAKYYPQSYDIARESRVNAVYIDYTPKIWLRDRVKPIITDQVITPDREFVRAACRIISQTRSAKILVWGAIHQLAYYRWAFPERTLAYAHRFYDQQNLRWAHQYSYCDYLLMLSTGAARSAFEQAHTLCPVVVTIPNGVDLDKYKPVSAEEKRRTRRLFGLPEDKIIAIFPSALRRKKGTDYLVHWVRYCLTHVPQVHFLVVGAFEGSENTDGLRVTELLKSADNVTWLGGVQYQQMPVCYQAADFCLMPSICPEGMSMASLEALASGVPVLCTKRGIFCDYIFDGYNGLLCRPESLYVEGLKSIETLVESPEVLKTMSINARVYAEKRLSRQRCLDNFRLFFEGRLSSVDGDLFP